MKFFTKKGFTLTELIISLTISVVLLIFVFSFVTDTILTLTEASERSRVLNQFYEFVIKFQNYKSTMTGTGTIITTNGGGTVVKSLYTDVGFGTILMKNADGSAGVLVGVIDPATKRLTANASYTTYSNKTIGFRELTSTNITSILATPSTIYTYDFYDDKMYHDVIVKSFTADYYNLGTILDINMTLVMKYSSPLDGALWSSLLNDNLFPVNLDF